MKPKPVKERHKLARTTVDVYRLFKIQSLAFALRNATDRVVSNLGNQIVNETHTMLLPYVTEQKNLSETK